MADQRIPEDIPGFEDQYPTIPADEPPTPEPPQLPPEEAGPQVLPENFTLPQMPLSLPPSTPGITSPAGAAAGVGMGGGARTYLPIRSKPRHIVAGPGTPMGSMADDPNMLKLIRGRLGMTGA